MALRSSTLFRALFAWERGLERSNKLSAEAMERTIDALRVCATKVRRHRVRWVRCVATEACRKAENGEAFIHQIEKATRLRLEIIDGKDEAELAAIGCGALFDRQFPHAVVFDIGGGSTEITCLSLNKGRYELQDMISLPLGVVRLSEKYDGTTMSSEIYAQIADDAEKMIRAFAEKQNFYTDNLANVQLIGTSGTVTTLAAIHKGLKKYNRNVVDGTVMKRDEVIAVIQSLMNMTHEERQNNNCIGKERADLVMSGCAVLEAIIRTWPVEELKIADRGIREGILLRLIRKTQRRQRMRRGRKTKGAGIMAKSGREGRLKTKVKTAKGRKISSTRWLERQLNDPYVAQAQQDGYRSRAAYKLIEIDDKYKLLKPGQCVVDLGCAPGGWLQVAVKRNAIR